MARYIDGIRVIDWWEHPLLQGVKEKFDVLFPDWKISGPYCPGKAGHHSFKAEKDGVKKMVHVADGTKEITVEEWVDWKDRAK